MKHTTGDAYEDILYGSESDLDESDADHRELGKSVGKTSKKQRHGGFLIREDTDEPMDLLNDAKTHLTRMFKIYMFRPVAYGMPVGKAVSAKRRKGGEDFSVNVETGKMMINENEPGLNDMKHNHKEEDVEGTAYRENMVSVEGFTRLPNGQIKFHKDTKKRRRENEETEKNDIEMLDETQGSGGGKASKRRETVMPGQVFKAKVRQNCIY